jgi:hypothetical protein
LLVPQLEINLVKVFSPIDVIDYQCKAKDSYYLWLFCSRHDDQYTFLICYPFYQQTSKTLLNESKIQARGCLAPCGFCSPWETFKDVKTKKLYNSNSLAKVAKLTPIFTNVKLYSTFKFTKLELILAQTLNLLQLASIVEDVYFVGIQKCIP